MQATLSEPPASLEPPPMRAAQVLVEAESQCKAWRYDSLMRVGVRDSPANKDAEGAKYREQLMMRIRDVGEDLLKTCHRFFATVGGLINHLVSFS